MNKFGLCTTSLLAGLTLASFYQQKVLADDIDNNQSMVNSNSMPAQPYSASAVQSVGQGTADGDNGNQVADQNQTTDDYLTGNITPDSVRNVTLARPHPVVNNQRIDSSRSDYRGSVNSVDNISANIFSSPAVSTTADNWQRMYWDIDYSLTAQQLATPGIYKLADLTQDSDTNGLYTIACENSYYVPFTINGQQVGRYICTRTGNNEMTTGDVSSDDGLGWYTTNRLTLSLQIDHPIEYVGTARLSVRGLWLGTLGYNTDWSFMGNPVSHITFSLIPASGKAQVRRSVYTVTDKKPVVTEVSNDNPVSSGFVSSLGIYWGDSVVTIGSSFFGDYDSLKKYNQTGGQSPIKLRSRDFVFKLRTDQGVSLSNFRLDNRFLSFYPCIYNKDNRAVISDVHNAYGGYDIGNLRVASAQYNFSIAQLKALVTSNKYAMAYSLNDDGTVTVFYHFDPKYLTGAFDRRDLSYGYINNSYLRHMSAEDADQTLRSTMVNLSKYGTPDFEIGLFGYSPKGYTDRKHIYVDMYDGNTGQWLAKAQVQHSDTITLVKGQSQVNVHAINLINGQDLVAEKSTIQNPKTSGSLTVPTVAHYHLVKVSANGQQVVLKNGQQFDLGKLGEVGSDNGTVTFPDDQQIKNVYYFFLPDALTNSYYFADHGKMVGNPVMFAGAVDQPTALSYTVPAGYQLVGNPVRSYDFKWVNNQPVVIEIEHIPATLTVVYYDLNGNQVGNTQTISGRFKEASHLDLQVPDHYVLHGALPVSMMMTGVRNEMDLLVVPKIDVSWEKQAAIRQIIVGRPDQVAPDTIEQMVMFKRRVTVNEVTNRRGYSGWQVVGQDYFDAYVPPIVDGYHADLVASLKPIGPGESDPVVVRYRKLEVKAVPKYIDSLGNIYEFLPAGYEVADGQDRSRPGQLIVKVQTTVTPIPQYVTRTVTVVMLNGRPRKIVQRVLKGTYYSAIHLPKLRGYRVTIDQPEQINRMKATGDVDVNVVFVKQV